MVIQVVYHVFVIIMVTIRISKLNHFFINLYLGSIPEVCNKDTGTCLCKANFTGQTCEQCAPGFFNHPTCEPCACDPTGVIYDGLLRMNRVLRVVY
jgi:hypothetical protein